jgi:hypothetical protein
MSFDRPQPRIFVTNGEDELAMRVDAVELSVKGRYRDIHDTLVVLQYG